MLATYRALLARWTIVGWRRVRVLDHGHTGGVFKVRKVGSRVTGALKALRGEATPDRFRAKIERADAEYATKLVGYLISSVIDEVRESLSENTDEKAKKRILKIVSTASYKGITRNELTRKTQFIRRSMREEYLEDLLDSGEIVTREQISGRNHVQLYFLAELAPKEA